MHRGRAPAPCIPPAEAYTAAVQSPGQIQIQIVSDFVCPWCYVGKRRLEAALASRPGINARISWLPYQLSPDMPREGRDRRAHYAAIFGPERARTIMEKMVATAAADGLVFATAPGARSPNTLAAHRLMYRAGQIAGARRAALCRPSHALGGHRRSGSAGAPCGRHRGRPGRARRLVAQ
ncbi:MAG: hypothetical protein FJ170_00235 [Gammaproteobacteria bacterium]|nr:hypothetical protein [Gammaproteobacteria bacterium]